MELWRWSSSGADELALASRCTSTLSIWEASFRALLSFHGMVVTKSCYKRDCEQVSGN